MLVAVKQMIRSNWWGPKRGEAFDSEQLEKLAIGSMVGFGFMPQALLSGKRIRVTSIQTYLFGEDRYTSFQLAAHKEIPIGVIIAGEEEPYLAISRPFALEEQEHMFGTEALDMIVEETVMKQLHTIERPESLKGWVVPSYRKTLEKIKGEVALGDYRDKPVPDDVPRRRFDYFLLVSETNDHAIEIERNEDGALRMYATVYRPISDIGEITAAIKPRPALQPVTPAPKPAKPAGTAFSLELPQEEAVPLAELPPQLPKAPELVMKAPEPPEVYPPVPAAVKKQPPAPVVAKAPEPMPVKVPEPAPVIEKVAAPVLVSKPKETPAPALEPREISLQTAQQDQTLLACDMRVAAKIIEEAVRNEISFSELVRRVVELPLQVKEKVYLPLDLSDEDYEQLAERYGLTENDREAIRQRVLNELANFAGEEI